MKLFKSEKADQLFFLLYSLSGKKIKQRQLNIARECEMCFHQARFKRSLSNPAGLLQQWIKLIVVNYCLIKTSTSPWDGIPAIFFYQGIAT